MEEGAIFVTKSVEENGEPKSSKSSKPFKRKTFQSIVYNKEDAMAKRRKLQQQRKELPIFGG
jgi:hypothetical protein